MSIRIARNEQGNCINFYGSSNPTYWNACLSGQVDSEDANAINVINDVITSQTGVTEYEFFRIPYTEFVDIDGNGFPSAEECARYITEKANVIGLGGEGTELTDTQVCFKLDDTSTSIMLDNGYSFGVNTIKATNEGDGLITLKSKLGDITHFSKLDHTSVCDGEGNAISGGLNDVINYLNELFTVGAFEQVVISDPYSTMVADVDGVTDGGSLVGSAVIDPAGNDIGANTTTHNNNAGYLSSETINQAGEYFTFDIRGEGQIGFGLVHTQSSYDNGYYSGNATYANPTSFCNGVNSSHYGYQFAHFFHPTPNGSWTNYGANTSYSMRSGWSGFPDRQNWLDGNPIKMRVGIDENGYISIDSYDPTTSTFVPHSRTSYVVPEGVEFKLGIKFSNPSARLYTTPKVHLLEEEAPTLYFRYIESPDGVFNYPLFATEEEANYYDEQNGGTGTSHTHTYSDDPTNTTWYMPTTNGVMNGTSAPLFDLSLGQQATYTEITSLSNADLAPPVFSQANITQEEGTNVNIQINPADTNYSTSVSISPIGSGLIWDGASMVQGTLSDVGADTTYTITVTRGNSYGSTTGSMTITATDVAPVQTNDTPWTKALDFSGSSERAQQVSSSSNYMPISMDNLSATASAPTISGNTSGHIYSRPWATACVFKVDGNNSNQHIWNQGEGAGSTDDNIYLRVSSSRGLYFGWGRGSDNNECYLGILNSSLWYGVYVAHNGTRLSATDATSQNLANCFDIRIMSSYSANQFTILGSNKSTSYNWTQGGTGQRMDRSVVGNFTIGGRGANRNFHGKVASFVSTTLRINQLMPIDAEIELTIKDPIKWLNDYKDGNTYRVASSQAEATFGLFNYLSNSAFATQVWLMGDGASDSYSNMIRNQVYRFDQNYTKLNLLSMVSNDIQNVNINGLT